MNSKFRYVCLLALTLFAVLYSQFDPILANKFQNALDLLLIENDIIGASVAIDMPEEGIWLGVSGMSDPVSGDSIRTDMLFSIASNTKTFIATIMLLLAEDGLLSLDDSLHSWLPSFENINPNTTIRQLLNHTSGIYDYTSSVGPGAADKLWTPEECLSLVLPPNFPPGESWDYSNTNYLLAGMIIKEVTGSEVSTILHEKILDPLNLTSTFLDVEEPLIGDLAHGWENGGDVFYTPRTSLYSFVWTAGAMVSNSEDLVKWAKVLYGGQILQQSSLDEMFTVIEFDGWGYGLGTWNENWYGENVWLHGGSLAGYRSQVIYCPTIDVSISVLLNQRPSDADIVCKSLFFEVLKYYYPELVYPLDINLSCRYMQANHDHLTVTSSISNTGGHPIQVYAKIVSVDSTYIDSTMLYDDGFHNDSLAGDQVFGNTFDIVPVEKMFDVMVYTIDLDTNYMQVNEQKIDQFSTIGHLVLNDYTTSIANNEDRYIFYIDVTLENLGNQEEVPYPNTVFHCPDSIFANSSYKVYFSNIQPGVRETRRIICRFKDGYIPMDSTEVQVSLDIYSGNFLYTKNNFSVFLESGINTTQIPKGYELYQNYPNPFNPTTTIEYSILDRSNVELKIYNISGSEVLSLVDQDQSKGRHKVEFNANSFTSGIYFYNLSIDNKIVSTKKMMLLK